MKFLIVDARKKAGLTYSPILLMVFFQIDVQQSS
jgi:hypothetical protein